MTSPGLRNVSGQRPGYREDILDEQDFQESSLGQWGAPPSLHAQSLPILLEPPAPAVAPAPPSTFPLSFGGPSTLSLSLLRPTEAITYSGRMPIFDPVPLPLISALAEMTSPLPQSSTRPELLGTINNNFLAGQPLNLPNRDDTHHNYSHDTSAETGIPIVETPLHGSGQLAPHCPISRPSRNTTDPSNPDPFPDWLADPAEALRTRTSAEFQRQVHSYPTSDPLDNMNAQPPSKRRRTSATGDDGLKDSTPGQSSGHSLFSADTSKADTGAVEVIDPSNVENASNLPQEPVKEKSSKKVKLSHFNCVICMDYVKDMTTTWCGHIFCGECLHGSLMTDPQKRVCPICRQKIDRRHDNGKFGVRARGYWPLELKLKRARRKSKQCSLKRELPS